MEKTGAVAAATATSTTIIETSATTNLKFNLATTQQTQPAAAAATTAVNQAVASYAALLQHASPSEETARQCSDLSKQIERRKVIDP